MAQNLPSTNTNTIPIAPLGCTLSDDELAERLHWLQEVVLIHAVHHQRIEQGHVIRLLDSPKLVADLDQLIKLETECCSGLRIEHHIDAETHDRILTLRGAQTVSIEQALVSALETSQARHERMPQEKRFTRLLRSTGIGTVVAASLCCVLPALIGLYWSAHVGSLFAGWDSPLVMSLIAVSGGCFVFFRGLRTGFSSLRKPSSSDCSNC